MIRPPVYTPWGAADHVKVIAEGITQYDTPSHGGIIITQERFDEMPPAFREYVTFTGHLIYEEDCDAIVVMVAFPQFFDADRISRICDTMRRCAANYPDYQPLLPHLPA